MTYRSYNYPAMTWSASGVYFSEDWRFIGDGFSALSDPWGTGMIRRVAEVRADDMYKPGVLDITILDMEGNVREEFELHLIDDGDGRGPLIVRDLPWAGYMDRIRAHKDVPDDAPAAIRLYGSNAGDRYHGTLRARWHSLIWRWGRQHTAPVRQLVLRSL